MASANTYKLTNKNKKACTNVKLMRTYMNEVPGTTAKAVSSASHWEEQNNCRNSRFQTCSNKTKPNKLQ
jgi:hypothetical protein